MKAVNAIKAVLRATGNGSTDAIRGHVPLDFSVVSNASMSSNHGSVWVNDIRSRDTSCVIELRNLYRNAAEAQDVAVRLHVTPCGAYSFPTQCIVSVSGSYARSEQELVQEGGKDIVLREWDLDRSHLFNATGVPFELELPLRAIMNIASLVAPPSKSSDPPVCRIFVGLRFVGCCDASAQHKIKQVTAEYVIGASRSRSESKGGVDVSAASDDGPRHATRTAALPADRQAQRLPTVAANSSRGAPSPPGSDADASIEIYVDERQWEPEVRRPNHEFKAPSQQTPEMYPPAAGGRRAYGAGGEDEVTASQPMLVRHATRSIPQDGGIDWDAVHDLDINTPASRRHPSASPSMEATQRPSSGPYHIRAQTGGRGSAARIPEELQGDEVEDGSTPVQCAPVRMPKTPGTSGQYWTANPAIATLHALGARNVPVPPTPVPAATDIPFVAPTMGPSAIAAPAKPSTHAQPAVKPRPVASGIDIGEHGDTPRRMHTLVAMSPAGVVDSPKLGSSPHPDEGNMEQFDDMTPQSHQHFHMRRTGQTAVARAQPSEYVDEALGHEPPASDIRPSTIQRRRRDDEDDHDTSTASLATYRGSHRGGPTRAAPTNNASTASSHAHDFDASPIPTLGSNPATRAAALPGMILQAQEHQRGRQRVSQPSQPSSRASSCGDTSSAPSIAGYHRTHSTSDPLADRSPEAAAPPTAHATSRRSQSPGLAGLQALSHQLATLVTEVRQSLSRKDEDDTLAPAAVSAHPSRAASVESMVTIGRTVHQAARHGGASRSTSSATSDVYLPQRAHQHQERRTGVDSVLANGVVDSAPPSRSSSPFRKIQTPHAVERVAPSTAPVPVATPFPVATSASVEAMAASAGHCCNAPQQHHSTGILPPRSGLQRPEPSPAPFDCRGESPAYYTASSHSSRAPSAAGTDVLDSIRVTPSIAPRSDFGFVPVPTRQVSQSHQAERVADAMISANVQRGILGDTGIPLHGSARAASRPHAMLNTPVTSPPMAQPSSAGTLVVGRGSNSVSVLLREVEAVVGRAPGASAQPSPLNSVQQQTCSAHQQAAAWAPHAATMHQQSIVPPSAAVAPTTALPQRHPQLFATSHTPPPSAQSYPMASIRTSGFGGTATVQAYQSPPTSLVTVPAPNTMTSVGAKHFDSAFDVSMQRTNAATPTSRFAVLAQPGFTLPQQHQQQQLRNRDVNASAASFTCVNAAAGEQASRLAVPRPPRGPPPVAHAALTEPMPAGAPRPSASEEVEDCVVVGWCMKHHRTRGSAAKRVLALVCAAGAPHRCTVYLNKKDGTTWGGNAGGGADGKPGCEFVKGDVIATTGLRAFLDAEAVHQKCVTVPERCIVFREMSREALGSPTAEGGPLILALEMCSDEDFARVVAMLRRCIDVRQ